MALKKPENMDDLVYFTRRAIGKGKAVCWVFKENCEKCGKALMGKPRDAKTGSVKIRANEYVCPECGHNVEKKQYEESLQANIEYTCPECSYEGEAQVPFKRKSYKGAQSVLFQCEKCKAKIPITKKMKQVKEKN